MTKKKTTIDDLAIMVKHGFDHITSTMADKNSINKRFDRLEGDMTQVKGDLSNLKGEVLHLNAVTTTIQRDVAEIRKQFVRRDEFDDLFGRVSYLERKLGIKSGK
ncbi:MAG: hypothetical protein AAB795_02440 [Patescibacteria group bacterium]